jgi:hypothetical protein
MPLVSVSAPALHPKLERVRACPPRRHSFAIASILLLGSIALCAAKVWPALPDGPAGSYPVVDRHGPVAIAADCYDTRAKAEKAFPKLALGARSILPVRIIVTNGSDRAINLRQARYELVLPDLPRLLPLEVSLVEDELLAGNGRKGHSIPLPYPFPVRVQQHASKAGVREQFESRLFQTSIVPPQTTESGFVFYRLPWREGVLDGASLYVNDIYSGDQPMFYFELHFGSKR